MLAERARRLGYLLVGMADLADKYHALFELHQGEPGRTTERRDAMRKIAARFPAALRELDQTNPEERERRAQDIEHVLALLCDSLEQGSGSKALDEPSRRWIRPTAELHAYLREILKVKRWLAGRVPSDKVMAELADWYAESGDPHFEIEHWTRERLEAISSPPQGRVTALAYEEVASRHGMTAAELLRELYPQTESSEDE
jgi:hypothetical protein